MVRGTDLLPILCIALCTTQGVYNEDLNKSSRARDQQMGKRFKEERQGLTPVATNTLGDGQRSMIDHFVPLCNVFEHVLRSRPWIHPGPVWFRVDPCPIAKSAPPQTDDAGFQYYPAPALSVTARFCAGIDQRWAWLVSGRRLLRNCQRVMGATPGGLVGSS